MRRPWIKIETCTPDKPEVCSIATQLRLDEDTVVGKLVRLWSWAELNRIDPNDIGVTKEFIDKLVGRKGFAAALLQTGWLTETNGKLCFRNFKRHNSPVAQNKALTAKRVARHRLRKAKAKEKVTAKPLAEDTVETPKVEETADSFDDVNDVINTDSSLVINEPPAIIEESTIEEPVTVPSEPEPVVEEQEAPPPVTLEQALATALAEEPAPRKKRAKANVENEDQPMLF